MDEIEPELTATPVMNSKAAKGNKPSVSASDKLPVPPLTVEMAHPISMFWHLPLRHGELSAHVTVT